MDKLMQIDKLLQVKELRRRLAEVQASRARVAMREAVSAVEQARKDEIALRETSDERRQSRLKNMLEGGGNIAVHNTRIANLYKMTEQEIEESKQVTEKRIQDMIDANDRVKIEQSKLARFLQLEERTRKLCERLTEIRRKEVARTN